jgi:hypothetical protein
MLKLNRGDQAKQCFMEALALDVKCFEAFDQLVTGEMMTPDEGTTSVLFSPSSYSYKLSSLQNGNSFKACHTRNKRLKMHNSSN